MSKPDTQRKSHHPGKDPHNLGGMGRNLSFGESNGLASDYPKVRIPFPFG
jgi:hypothetical protein